MRKLRVLAVSLMLVVIMLVISGCKIEKVENNELVNQPVKNSLENNTNNTNNSVDNTNIVNTNKTDSSFEISYKNEEYTTTNNENKIVFKNERNVATVTSTTNSEAAKNIENKLKEISNERWKYLNDNADEYTAAGMTAYDNPYGVSFMMKTLVKNSKYITIEADQTGGMGGVSWTEIDYYTFDTQNGQLLTWSNMTDNESGLKQFAKERTKEFINNNFQNIQARDLDSAINEAIETSGNYGLTEDKLVIVLQKYSIGAGADGVKVVEIDKADVNQYLLDKYKM